MQDTLPRSADTVEDAACRQLYLQMPLPCWVYDRHSLALLDANAAAERLYGYSRAELLELDLYALHAPAEAGRLRALLAAHAAGGPAGEHSEWVHRHRAGTDLYVRVKTMDIAWAGREARVVFVTDFSERQAASTEIKLLYDCLERAHDMVLVAEADVNAEGHHPIVYVNAALEKRTGYSRAELMGRNPRLLQGAGIDPVVCQRIDQAMARWEQVKEEMLNRTRSGEPYWVEMTLSPVADEWGRYRFWLAVARDITERKQAEAALADRNEALEARVNERTLELQHTVRDLEFFNRAVSHDLHNPLNGVRGFAELMAKKHGPAMNDDGRRMLGLIRRSADQMNCIIEDLLSLGRVSRMALSPDMVDLAALCRPRIDALQNQQPQRHVQWVLPLQIRVHADLQLLGVVVEQLLGNAWKYSAQVAEARIEISVQPCAAGQVLTVSDNGVGFDPAGAQALFTPFQRLHSQADFEGTGIGLAIVARAVHRLRGWVWADSSRGQGTRVHVFLPAPGLAGMSTDAIPAGPHV